MQPIVCRYDRKLRWIILPALALPAILFFGSLLDPNMAKDPIAHTIIWPICALLLFGPTYFASDMIYGEVSADDDGLRWREGFSRMKSARWEEITDFYHREGGGRYVETPAGLCEMGSSRKGIDEIIALVPQRAANAAARVWGIRGFRPHDEWQQTLVMWRGQQKWVAPALTLFSALPAVVFGTGFLILAVTAISQPLDWWRLGAGVVGLILVGSVALVFALGARGMWRDRRFAWEHRDENLHLDARGVRYESENQTIEAQWNEIARVLRLPDELGIKSYQVRTARGDFVLCQFSNVPGMWAPFRDRCRYYAPAAIENTLADEAPHDMNVELQPRTDGVAKVFSFRTRGNRLIVWATSITLFASPLLYLAFQFNGPLDQPFAPSWLLFRALCLAAIFVSIPFYLWFARARIVVAKSELQLHSPFRRVRRIDLNEVEMVGADVWGNWLLVRGRKIYWMRALAPARVEELRGIERNSLDSFAVLYVTLCG